MDAIFRGLLGGCYPVYLLLRSTGKELSLEREQSQGKAQEYMNEGFLIPYQDTDGYCGWLLLNFSEGQLTV